MGWWGTEVMAGDTPLDNMYMYERRVIPEELLDQQYDREFTAEELKVFARRADELNGELWDLAKIEFYEQVAIQTFGVFLMKIGARISIEDRAAIILAAEEDEWAESNKERRAVMQSFIKDIKEYVDGVPTELTLYDRGLLAKMGL